jgi:phage-related protein
MSDMTYYKSPYSFKDKPLAWLHGQVKTPPFSAQARLEAGFLIRRLQKSERLAMPHSRPMTSIGRRCHELRIIYRIDQDAIVILEVFEKKTSQTPKQVIDTCKGRIRDYENATK